MFRIEPLGPHHDRGAFCCGNKIIDKFCGEQALRDHKTNRVRVFVACEDNSNRVAGFYSLCVSTLEPKTFLGFGKRPIPAVYLAMLGVCGDFQGNGLGTALMVDAFERTLTVADNAGAYCLWLHCVDEPTAAFYAGLKFERVEAGELRMYIPVETIRDALTATGDPLQDALARDQDASLPA